MEPKKVHIKDFTCTNGSHTILSMDAGAKKILERINDLERIRWDADREISSLRRALEVMDIKPAGAWEVDLNETGYIQDKPFEGKTLVETCETILNDHCGRWFTKSQIEYLAIRGGFAFDTPNPTNSVEVTLRRLADGGKCSADRARGKRGNRYCIPEAKKEKAS